MNCLRVLLSHSFNVHASLLGVDAAQPLVLTVMQECKIDLSVNVNTFVHKNRLDREACGCRLMSDEVVANHPFRLLADELGGFDDVDASLHAGCEVSFSSATSLHLSFDHKTSFVRKCLGYFCGFVSSESELSLLDVDTVFTHEFLGMELVKVEEADWVLGQ